MWARFAPAAGRLMHSILAVPAFGVNSRWWRGQDSNLRSPSGQRFYRPLVLATHAPLRLSGWSPRGDSNPLTYRLQVGCATVAPRGRASAPGAEQKYAPDTSGLTRAV